MSREEEDFGFSISFVDEAELRSIEKELAKKNEDIQATSDQTKDRLEKMKKMVMILLNNLLKEPDKNYILWPNRVKDVEEFKKKLDNI